MNRVQELEEALRKVIDLQFEYRHDWWLLYEGLEDLKVELITPLLLKGQDNDNNS